MDGKQTEIFIGIKAVRWSRVDIGTHCLHFEKNVVLTNDVAVDLLQPKVSHSGDPGASPLPSVKREFELLDSLEEIAPA